MFYYVYVKYRKVIKWLKMKSSVILTLHDPSNLQPIAKPHVESAPQTRDVTVKRAGYGISGTSGIKWTKCSEMQWSHKRCQSLLYVSKFGEFFALLLGSVQGCYDQKPTESVMSRAASTRRLRAWGPLLLIHILNWILPHASLHAHSHTFQLFCQTSLSKNGNNMHHHLKYINILNTLQ